MLVILLIKEMQFALAVLWNEQFLTEVPVDDMTRDQLETRAIRMILNHNEVGRSDLQAIPKSFKAITDVTEINMDGLDLRAVSYTHLTLPTNREV